MNKKNSSITLIIALLSGLLIICFSSYFAHNEIINNGFISNFDDNVYILENKHVKQGLTKESFFWALKSVDNGFWHPVTWLSLMYDVDEKLSARPFHKTALILHIINSGLLFILFCLLTSKLIPSFLAALIFAVHPMHVESIAWASQRKDLLCFLFMMFTLIFYYIYIRVKKGKAKTTSWIMVIVSFFLCVASKSSAVFLPIVLLLLDHLIFYCNKIGSKISFKTLIKEKIPLFIISAASGIVTILAQTKYNALSNLDSVGIAERIKGCFIFYWLYLKKIFFPTPMLCFYPRPLTANLLFATLGFLLFIIFGILTIKNWKNKTTKHTIIVSFFILSISLYIPVSGLIQVGSYSIADRFSYFINPWLYFVIIYFFSFPVSIQTSNNLTPLNINFSIKKIIVSASVLYLAFFSLIPMSKLQSKLWKNGITLFRHAAISGINNTIVWNNFGSFKAQAGLINEAKICFEKALHLNPSNIEAMINLANCYSISKEYKKSIPLYGKILIFLGEINTYDDETNFLINSVGKNNIKENFVNSNSITSIFPSQTQKLMSKNIATMLAMDFDNSQQSFLAEKIYKKLITIYPNENIFLWKLSQNLFNSKKIIEAEVYTETFITKEFINISNTNNKIQNSETKVAAMLQLASIKINLKKYEHAVMILKDALKESPENSQAHIAMAWLLQFSGDKNIKNPKKSLEIAQNACYKDDNYRPEALATLALIYAAQGDFKNAIQSNATAISDAATKNLDYLANEFFQRQAKYEKNEFPFPDLLK